MAWENNRPDHVPTRVREACLQRDGHRCVAIQHDGKRCPETTKLEAAHKTQWQQGETTTVDMVRTLCHWHHNRETQAEAAKARKANAARLPTATHPRETHPAFR